MFKIGSTPLIQVSMHFINLQLNENISIINAIPFSVISFIFSPLFVFFLFFPKKLVLFLIAKELYFFVTFIMASFYNFVN